MAITAQSVKDFTQENKEIRDIEPLWTVEEVAIYMRLKPETVRSMARRNLMPAIKVGKVWRFRSLAIKEWLNEEK